MNRRLLTYLASITAALNCTAQQTWRFHVAFEDGAGAKDTMWFVYDTSATIGWGPGEVDYNLGEGGVDMDLTAFNVWQLNWDFDSTKTNAWPYSEYPILQGGSVNAFNWQPPITIRWDTSLFHAPYLPGPDTFGLATMGGEYFFFNNNHPELQAFDMLLTDHVVVSNDVDYLFPITMYFGTDETGILESDKTKPIEIWPNPTSGPIHWNSSESAIVVRVIDSFGRDVLPSSDLSSHSNVDLSDLPNGLYILELRTTNNQVHHARIVKQTPP